MSNWKMNRRYFMTSSGAVFLLPLMESLGKYSQAFAATNTDPKRMLSIYLPNGTYNRPEDGPWNMGVGTLKNLNLSRLFNHALLTPMLGDITILQHLSQKTRDAVADSGGGNGGHSSSVSTWLSQLQMKNGSSPTSSMPGASVDVRVAAKLPGNKPVLAMSGGATVGGSDTTAFDYSESVSFNVNGTMLYPNTVPVNLYKQMFSNLVAGATPAPSASASSANKKSVLDLALTDIKDLQSKLGKNDVARLDDYLNSIQNLEKQLVGTPAASASATMASQCGPGTAPASTLSDADTGGGEQNYVQRMNAFFDMAVLAFKCDLTRVVTIMMDADCGARKLDSQFPDSLRLNSAQVTGDIHTGVSHYQNPGVNSDMTITRDRVFMWMISYLINGLKAAKDPSGSTILDNTAFMSGFAVLDGTHDVNVGFNMAPQFMAGGSNLGFHPGQSLNLNGNDIADVWYTIQNALGANIGSVAGSTKILTL